MTGCEHIHGGVEVIESRGRDYGVVIRGKKQDAQTEGKQGGVMLSEIGYIKANTDEIKAEQKEQRKTNLEYATRLTAVEASSKQAYKRIDTIEGRTPRDKERGITMNEHTKTWLKAAGVRALKTLAQTAVATIGTTAVMSEVNWILVMSTSALAAILSLLTSVAGLPEVKK